MNNTSSTRWTDAFLDEQRQIGDPEADSAIDALQAAGQTGAALTILRTLVRNEQPPPEELPESVRGYITETRALPPWADTDLILRGEHLFQRWGMQIGLLLFHKAMAEGYMAQRFSRVLNFTTSLASDPRRRLLETGQLIFDAMAPGGLGIGGKGIATALRVRLLHAVIRRNVKDRAASDPALWPADLGAPISQEDMAFTLMGFSIVILDGLAQMGARVSTADAEAFVHCWRVVGYFIGIEDEMNPSNLAEARELLAVQRRRQYVASPDGIALEAAMIAMLEGMSPGPMRHVPRQMVRYLIGEEYSTQLQVPKAGRVARLGFGGYIRLNRALLTFVSVTRIANLAEPFNRRLMHAMIGSSRGGERPPFAVPPDLQRKWRL